MIRASIISDDGEKFRIRVQHKIDGGEWTDYAVDEAVGRSQCYSADKGRERIIIEDIHGIPLNVLREA